MNPKILCLSSGGSKGLAHLGVLSYFEYHKHLDQIETYVGCSIGSLICLLLNCGYKPAELAEYFLEFKLDYQLGISNIIDDYGFYDMKQMSEKISLMVKSKLGFVPTLKELYELTNKRLIISTYNIDRMENYYFDYFTEPTCSVVDAVCISMSIPIFFKAWEYKGYRFVDGAVGDPFSIDLLDDGKTPILGVVLYSDKKPVHSFINFISKLSEGNNKEYVKMKLKDLKKNCEIIELECIDPDFFNVNYDERMSVYAKGYRAAQHVKFDFCKEDNEIIQKINEICSPPLLSVLGDLIEKKPELVLESFKNMPYYQMISLCKISDMFVEIKRLKARQNVVQVKNTIYHHLHRIMSIIIPKYFWSRIPLVKEKI